MDFERKDGGPPPAHSNYDPSYVAAFYDRDPESEWLRLVRSPLEEIKLHIHEHYLRKYMTSEMRVLEIGAGPGRFTKTLHELGCSVVVGDISAKQLEANKEKARELGFGASVERWIQIDICDMAAIDSGAFDAVVAYGGPISYVFDRAGDAGELLAVSGDKGTTNLLDVNSHLLLETIAQGDAIILGVAKKATKEARPRGCSAST